MKVLRLKSFALNNLKPHQLESLVCWKVAGGLSYIFIADVKEFEKRNKKCYLIPVDDWGKLTKVAVFSGRKSIAKKYLEWYALDMIDFWKELDDDVRSS